VIGSEQLREWDDRGFFFVRGFAPQDVTRAMWKRVVEVCRERWGEDPGEGSLVMPESNLRAETEAGAAKEDLVSKVFKLHRDGVFRDFVDSEPLVAISRQLIGAEVDCFLSQFIFKNPGAWGQPWHQDEFYFPFDRHPQVGFWLAVSDATLENGCLYVLPGSHRDPVHEHVPDRRPNANVGYLEIVDRETTEAIPVQMRAGDLLVFHSRLMHCSSNNESDAPRAAMVYHVSERGTVDHTGHTIVNDWMPIGDDPADG